MLSGAPGCHWVACRACGLQTGDKSKERAADQWNRLPRNAPADVVEAANNLTVKLTKWLIMNDTLPEDGSMVKVTDRFGTFCDDLLTEALASQPDLRELLKEARTGLSVLMDTSDDFTETGHMNLAQAANLIGRIDAALGESHDTNG